MHPFKQTLRWLLRVDDPVPDRTEAEIAALVERDYGWNFTVNLLDGAFFMIAMSLASSATIIPLFISKLTTSSLAIGLAAVIAQAGWFLPQLFTSNFIERLDRKKPVIVNLGFFTERLPYWLLVVAALLAVKAPGLALAIFFVGYASFSVGAGLVGPAWQDLIARCFPANRRGRLLGLTTFIGTGLGAIAAALSGRLLANFAFPLDFAYSFALAALAILASWVFLALTREPAQRSTAPRQSNRQYWSKLPALLRQDRNYRYFVAARLLLVMGGMAMGFITVAAVRRWALPDSTVAGFTAALLIGQTIGNLASGLIADRRGHKLPLELGALMGFVAFLFAAWAPSAAWYYVVFFLLGLNSGALFVSGILVVLEFAPPDRRPTYVGMTNSFVGVASIVAPLIGAVLADLGFNWLFLTSALFNLVALIAMHWWVREPRWPGSSAVAPPL